MEQSSFREIIVIGSLIKPAKSPVLGLEFFWKSDSKFLQKVKTVSLWINKRRLRFVFKNNPVFGNVWRFKIEREFFCLGFKNERERK